MIHYSIIIPHKNCVDLLQNCLDSIPVRDDVQVIIVDDNSDASLVDFDHFPKWRGANYECYLTKEGGGAGFCRNVGLDHAKGKWVLFVDADDFVLPVINSIFDECVDEDADIIYFRPSAVMLSDRRTPSKRADGYNGIIDRYQDSGDENELRVMFLSPCSKFVKRTLIDENNIRFDEIRYGNDNYFAAAIGAMADKIKASDDSFYVITESGNSLTSNFMKKPGELECRTAAFYRACVMSYTHGLQISSGIAFNFMGKLFGVDNSLFCKYYQLMRDMGFGHLESLKKAFKGYPRITRFRKYIHATVVIACYFMRNSRENYERQSMRFAK